MNQTPAIKYSIRLLTKAFKAELATAQKAFNNNPNSINWQNTHLAMFDYQQWMVAVTSPRFSADIEELVMRLQSSGRDAWGGMVCHFVDAERFATQLEFKRMTHIAA
jgi:hypothetical protein